jgi:hypothetical protein
VASYYSFVVEWREGRTPVAQSEVITRDLVTGASVTWSSVGSIAGSTTGTLVCHVVDVVRTADASDSGA